MRTGYSLIVRLGTATLLAVTTLGGCAEKTAEPTVSYQAVLDTKQLMDWIIDPSSDVVWGAAGTIMTLDGEQDLAPTTQAGWDAVRNAAATLAETGNLLKMPGISRGADWNEIAGGLTRTGELLIGAAERQDDEQVFDYGGQLYNVCVACHQIYLLPGLESE
ncbi:MAG: hypothetical protein PVF57_00120 [Pseudomonadales bacterium]|jgi:hypothetical protein